MTAAAAQTAAMTAAVARERLAKRAMEAAELEIARELDGYTVECYVSGREKCVTVADSEGTLVAMFRCLNWKRATAAAFGWHGVKS